MTTPTSEERRFTAALFGRDDPPAVPLAPKRPNYVAREGTLTSKPVDHDAEMRRFTGELFFGFYDG